MENEPERSAPADDPTKRALAEVLYEAIDIKPGTARTLLPNLLEAIRLHLSMEVGFLSRFHDGRRIFEYVSDDGDQSLIAAGDSGELEASYCLGVVEGRIPGVINNAQEHDAVNHLDATHNLGIGAHISVPIQLREGDVYGTLCCFSTSPDESLDERDLNFMSVIADLIGGLLQHEISHIKALEQKRENLDDVMHSGGLHSVWQPTVDSHTGRIISVEALARFNTRPYRPPNEWFEEAAEIDRHIDLERNALIKGLAILPVLPDNTYVSCNLSGQALMNPEIQEFLRGRKLDRIILEITEHDIITDYDSLIRILAPLRNAGMLLAIDDFGAGYASFRHILGLQPDIIKIDMGLVRNLDTNNTGQSVVRAIASFAAENQVGLVAEGVETERELQMLRSLGVHRIQGYLLHKPMGRDDLTRVFQSHKQCFYPPEKSFNPHPS